jgi:hypothetical protein
MTTCTCGHDEADHKYGACLVPGTVYHEWADDCVMFEQGAGPAVPLLGFEPSPQEIADAFEFRRTHVGITCKYGHHTRTADLLGHPDDPDFRCAHCALRGLA